MVTGGRVDLPSSGLLEGEGLAALGTIQNATYSSVALSADIVSTVSGKYSAGRGRRHTHLAPWRPYRIEGALSPRQKAAVALRTLISSACGPCAQARTLRSRRPGQLTVSEREAARRAILLLAFASHAVLSLPAGAQQELIVALAIPLGARSHRKCAVAWRGAHGWGPGGTLGMFRGRDQEREGSRCSRCAARASTTSDARSASWQTR